MRVLVACEESQVVCTAFRRRGHEAYSADIQEPSGGHPEWHILGDVLPILNGRCSFKTMDGCEHEVSGRWDMILAFVPCTKTSNAGARHLYKGGVLNIPRFYEGLCGKALFMAVWMADCEKIVIENPTPSKIFEYPTPTQTIQPYMFGHPYTKKPFYGKKAFHRLNQQILLSLKERGARLAAIPVSIMKSTKECLRGIEQRTGQRHFMAWGKQWQNNGVDKK